MTSEEWWASWASAQLLQRVAQTMTTGAMGGRLAAQTKGLDVGTRVVHVETTACDNRLRMRRQTFRMRHGDQPNGGGQGDQGGYCVVGLQSRTDMVEWTLTGIGCHNRGMRRHVGVAHSLLSSDYSSTRNRKMHGASVTGHGLNLNSTRSFAFFAFGRQRRC